MFRERKQAQEEQRGLHESSKADRRHLLAPLHNPVRESSWQREHIQSAHRHLDQKNSTPLNILKEHAHHAVRKSEETEYIQKPQRNIR